MESIVGKKTVFVGMSGGVDSSVAAYLLKRQGYHVVGVFLRSYNVDGCAERDAADARMTAGVLGIPFYTIDVEAEYRAKVVDYMIDGYRRGITPNPDVMCNKHIKFGVFLEKARALGADYIATGHYVRLRTVHGRPALCAAKDTTKDQSYFLWTLTQKQLERCLFPIGDYRKSHVRRIAKRAGLPTAEKKDSQGICFLGAVSMGDFLKQYIPETAGPIVTSDGTQIGSHTGAFQYTIGQRHLGIPGFRAGAVPHYVAKKDVATNTITVAPSEDPSLYTNAVRLSDIRSDYSWTELQKMPLRARIRYRQPLVRVRADRKGVIRFTDPQKFAAPGQSVVLYRKPLFGAARIVAGGTIVEGVGN